MLCPRIFLSTLLVRVVKGRTTTLHVAYPAQVRVCVQDTRVWSAVIFEEGGDRRVLDQSTQLVQGDWAPLACLEELYGSEQGGVFRKLAEEALNGEEKEEEPPKMEESPKPKTPPKKASWR